MIEIKELNGKNLLIPNATIDSKGKPQTLKIKPHGKALVKSITMSLQGAINMGHVSASVATKPVKQAEKKEIPKKETPKKEHKKTGVIPKIIKNEAEVKPSQSAVVEGIDKPIRVSELAARLGKKSKDVIFAAKEIEIRNLMPMSNVTAEQANKIIEEMAK